MGEPVMTEAAIEAALREALSRIAPETKGTAIDPSADLREAIELDSMDFLKFVQAISDKLGVAVPESDYPKVFSLGGAVSYVSARRASGGG